MALRFADSFDHYLTAELLSKWTSQPGTAGAISSAAARNGTQGYRMNSSSQSSAIKVLDAQATWIFGFAWRTASVAPTADLILVQLLDGATAHVDVRLIPTGFLRVTRAGTTLATGTRVLSANVFYFIEFKVTIGDAGAGSYELRINEVTELVDADEDTRNAGNASADRFALNSSSSGGPNVDYDDLYVCDGTGAVNNTFLGDVRVQAINPSGNGNSSAFDGSDGNQVDNYLLVDELTQDGDTTYVESPDIGDKDTYVYGDVTPVSGTVAGVQVLPYARKTEAGTRSLVSVARHTTNEEDSAAKTLSTSYVYLPDIRETKPGGGAWTIAELNATEFGIKVSA